MSAEKKNSLFAFLLFSAGFLFAGPDDSFVYKWRPVARQFEGHEGRITALAYTAPEEGSENRYLLSAGEDGFLCVRDRADMSVVLRYELSRYAVTLMKAHPFRSEIAFVENLGTNAVRLCVMNYWTRGLLFTFDFPDGIAFIDYSPQGSFLLVSTQRELKILDARLGREVFDAIPDSVSYAAASPSEKTVAVYSPSGRLSYWSLETGKSTANFATAAFLSSPLLFRNYNLFAGFLNGELLLINASTGKTLLREKNIRRGELISMEGVDDERFAIVSEDGIRVYSLSSENAFNIEETFNVKNARLPALSFAGVFFVLTGKGGLLKLSKDGVEEPPPFVKQTKITNAVVFNKKLLARGADGTAAEIPAAYSDILAGAEITLSAGAKDKAFPSDVFEDAHGNGMFLFITQEGVLAANAETSEPIFKINVPEINDAIFIDEQNIVTLSGGGNAGKTLTHVNIKTGTSFTQINPAGAGSLYRGKSGTFYIGSTSGIVKTDFFTQSIRRFIIASERVSPEDFDMAECGETFVTNINSGRTAFYSRERAMPLFYGEIAGGFHRRFIDADGSLIAIDDEGSVLWLDPNSGRINAILRIYKGEWELITDDGGYAAGR